jgi:putative flippase GtrA
MATINIKGKIKLICKDIHGNIKWQVEKDNLIVSAGKAQIALLAGDASATPFTYLAVGTSNTATAAGQTALLAEITDSGLARAAATVTRTTTTVTNDTLNLAYTWTASGTKTVEEIGVFNASSSGTMLGRALTTSKSLVSGEQLIASYSIIFS